MAYPSENCLNYTVRFINMYYIMYSFMYSCHKETTTQIHTLSFPLVHIDCNDHNKTKIIYVLYVSKRNS